MVRFVPLCVTFGAVLTAGSALAVDGPPGEKIPDFAPNPKIGWVLDRAIGTDDLQPSPSGGPGPVVYDRKYPYVPNGNGRQSTYRVADLSNPILQEWLKPSMKKANDEVIAGKVPFRARERCWPAGLPAFDAYSLVEPYFFYQMKDKILIVNELNTQVRHVYLDVPHSKDPKSSWYGESVGHYDGDTLVVDTIGLNDKTFVDNYRTPHTDKIHVVERFRMIEGGKILEATITVDDPGAFNMPWSGIQRWRRTERPFEENPCENNDGFFSYDVVPIPKAEKSDF